MHTDHLHPDDSIMHISKRLFSWRMAMAMLGICACIGLPAAAAAAEPKHIDYESLKLAEVVKRANANDANAQFELGSRFNYGRGTPKNVREALVWLRRAAQRGQIDAQRLLAVKLYNGYDVETDYEEALRWTQRLAESGDAPGQMMLGSMYANGEGGPRNLVRAYMWYDIAATTPLKPQDDPKLHDTALDLRDKTAALLLPDEEAEAQQLASDWWLRRQGVTLAPKAKKPARKSAAGKAKSTTGKSNSAAKPKSSGSFKTNQSKTPAKPAAQKP